MLAHVGSSQLQLAVLSKRPAATFGFELEYYGIPSRVAHLAKVTWGSAVTRCITDSAAANRIGPRYLPKPPIRHTTGTLTK